MTTCCIYENGLLDYSVSCAEQDRHPTYVLEQNDSNSCISRTEKLIGGCPEDPKHITEKVLASLNLGWNVGCLTNVMSFDPIQPE